MSKSINTLLKQLELEDKIISPEEKEVIISIAKQNKKFEESFNRIAQKLTFLKQSLVENESNLTLGTLPDITTQLEKVLEQTDEGTNSILNNCDLISEEASKIGSPHQEVINEYITHIFEASNFHDLTTQRIKKVLKVLAEVESQVKNILPQDGIDKLNNKAKELNLLNGPEIEPPSQEDIDQLFGEG